MEKTNKVEEAFTQNDQMFSFLPLLLINQTLGWIYISFLITCGFCRSDSDSNEVKMMQNWSIVFSYLKRSDWEITGGIEMAKVNWVISRF